VTGTVRADRHAGDANVKPTGLPDVGAPDPDRETSPIADECYGDDEAAPEPGDEVDGVCLYNDAPYEVGAYVWAGDEVLRCERGGVWMRVETELE
jgi:hypothetical protein